MVITGRDAATLEQTAGEISPEGQTVTPLVCDVADGDQIKQAVARVVGEFGRIDTLLNVAGVNRRSPAEDFSEDDFDFILNINLRGAWLMSQQVGRRMLEQGRGAQINITSLNVYAPLKHVMPYAASKAGMTHMTRTLAMEWGPRGVRVNALAPGFILTDMTQKLWSREDMHAWGIRNTPVRRLGKPDDMVGTAVFLASQASAFMTGQTLFVDGGFSAGLNWPIDEEEK